MKKTEVVKLITVTATLWPTFRGPQTDDEMDLAVETWRAVLDDVPPDLAVAAVHALATSGREFAPPVGVIRQKAVQLVAAAIGQMAPSVDEAWAEVRQKASELGYMNGPPAEWSHRAVDDAVAAIGWREICHSTNPEALRAHFMKLYGSAVDRAAEQRDMPAAVRETAARIGHRLPELKAALQEDGYPVDEVGA